MRLKEEHPAASQALPMGVEAAGSLSCSSRWQCQTGAVLLGPCQCPERKDRHVEVEMENNTGFQANSWSSLCEAFVAGSCDKGELEQRMNTFEI